MKERRRIVVVGGGIAGMAAAHRAIALSPDIEIVLLEQERRLGGKIVTERFKGFVVEGGPDSFLASKPQGVALATDLGIAGRLTGTRLECRRTFVMGECMLHEMPAGLTGLVPSRLEPLLASRLFSESGKERLRQEPAVPMRSGEEDESIGSFVSRRFGREVYERLIEPLMAGIYAGDGDTLSLLATFPQLRSMEREYGSLTAAMDRPRHSPSSGRSAFLTFPTGMAEMSEGLSESLRDVQVRLGTRVRSVSRRNSTLHVQTDNGTVEADTVILAVPSFQAAEIVSAFDSDLATELAAIPYVSSATVALGYRRADVPHDLAGYGYVVPRVENRAIMACTWVSSKFAARAPAGYVLIRAFIGRAGQQEALTGSDSDLVSLAREEMRAMLGVSSAPVLERVFRWERAMPQYTLGHLDRLARIAIHLSHHPEIALAGHAYRGVGIPDCIASGEAAAEQVLAFT